MAYLVAHDLGDGTFEFYEDENGIVPVHDTPAEARANRDLDDADPEVWQVFELTAVDEP